ncbi:MULTISPECIES: SDR family oxidoreductase [Hyphomonas]|jgi:NAD(P)-dependent dehydrogenase (short-subunit alcohol dehydrogenase family)|uniref:3-oxoacyl-ACP reductase n=2 Tax=Hyphomonas atlantica TaxID=1280948 RepID=A0A059EBL7_9PROT|nr:SDR family oxidoreductase [Hyphomonas atlantica]KCZ65043.1 short-chain dehydrogenase [Hyphomonas atlantica]HAE94778.1 3-oxoacyl-ACP reductase [Hyphomonas atlantica]HBF91239.1 3-oxoacyl-ACP reductase [Hyphomonas atlantica]HBH44395.1 3-oxoacyl-ACP reductase [Hyphomonas atlantica]|tara:strand:- start:80 stop:856 length:777 start_codon:yes stop_codon:yes gene_type:complete
MGRVDGKKAFITGGAQGLGEATARMFAREGAKVTVTDINGAGAEAVAASINEEHGAGTAFAYQHDVTDGDRWQEVLKGAYDAMGGLNVLVNNAGIGSLGSVEDEDYETFKHVQTVDVDSIFLGCKYAIPMMRDHGLGSIINISSIAGIIASGNYVSYNTAKAAVRHISKSIALHCAKSTGGQIRCNSVHPVFINTPILDRTKEMFGEEEALAKLGRQIPLGKVGEPDDIAYAVLYLASDESKLVTGIELKVDGGISAM